MGTHTMVKGEMNFSRPLTSTEAIKLAPALDDEWNIWKLERETQTRSGEDGWEQRREVITGIGLLYEDEIKAIGCGWDRTLERLIRLLPADVQVSGVFEGEVTDGDWCRERLYVVGRTVLTVRPEVIWSDPPPGALL